MEGHVDKDKVKRLWRAEDVRNAATGTAPGARRNPARALRARCAWWLALLGTVDGPGSAFPSAQLGRARASGHKRTAGTVRAAERKQVVRLAVRGVDGMPGITLTEVMGETVHSRTERGSSMGMTQPDAATPVACVKERFGHLIAGCVRSRLHTNTRCRTRGGGTPHEQQLRMVLGVALRSLQLAWREYGESPGPPPANASGTPLHARKVAASPPCPLITYVPPPETCRCGAPTTRTCNDGDVPTLHKCCCGVWSPGEEYMGCGRTAACMGCPTFDHTPSTPVDEPATCPPCGTSRDCGQYTPLVECSECGVWSPDSCCVDCKQRHHISVATLSATLSPERELGGHGACVAPLPAHLSHKAEQCHDHGTGAEAAVNAAAHASSGNRVPLPEGVDVEALVSRILRLCGGVGDSAPPPAAGGGAPPPPAGHGAPPPTANDDGQRDPAGASPTINIDFDTRHMQVPCRRGSASLRRGCFFLESRIFTKCALDAFVHALARACSCRPYHEYAHASAHPQVGMSVHLYKHLNIGDTHVLHNDRSRTQQRRGNRPGNKQTDRPAAAGTKATRRTSKCQNKLTPSQKQTRTHHAVPRKPRAHQTHSQHSPGPQAVVDATLAVCTGATARATAMSEAARHRSQEP
eukprot:jgi/Ulvmu1/11088/UM070_0002.1